MRQVCVEHGTELVVVNNEALSRRIGKWHLLTMLIASLCVFMACAMYRKKLTQPLAADVR